MCIACIRFRAALGREGEKNLKLKNEDDVHKCGRCQSEFTTLEDFVQHKIQKSCQRTPQEATTASAAALLGQEVVPSGEESITVAHIVVETSSISEDVSSAPDIIGGGHIKEVIVAAADHVFENPTGPGDSELAEGPVSPEDAEQDVSTELLKVKLLVNKEGRYVCELCHKTFKTASILKAHMITHSSKKDYECKLCGTSFRTKGSLIRHHRRHTDERPYKCKNCGKSFRESGALTRHLKSLTPCTEKIRFNMNREVVVSKEDVPPGSSDSNTETVTAITSESIETTPPVIHLVTDDKGTVIHEVHVQMQELPVDVKTLTSVPEKVPSEGEVSSENLLRQAMQNSGLVIERVAVEEGPMPAEPCVGTAQEPGPEGVRTGEQHFVAVEEVQTVGAYTTGYPQYSCPQCVEVFRSASALEVHAKAHVVWEGVSQGLPVEEAPGGACQRAALPLWRVWEALQDYCPCEGAPPLWETCADGPGWRGLMQTLLCLTECPAGALPDSPGGEAPRVPILQPGLPGEGLPGAACPASHWGEAFQVLQMWPGLC
uniref:E4F transcription factor 1 n=2 Tax=Vombatus ursinus TaxID=29139 RepID=A0A4X2KRU6_VOMUR